MLMVRKVVRTIQHQHNNVASFGSSANKITLLAELKACSITRNLTRGKQLHAEALKSANISCIYVSTALVNMYAKCGSMIGARQVFDKIIHPNVVSWNTLILGYAENREGITALGLFAKMKSQGFAPNSVTFIAALKSCTSLALGQDEKRRAECRNLGKKIHSEIGWHLDSYVQSTLIDMYANCGSMVDARRLFDSIDHPDVVSWNALLLGYAENGEGATAFPLLAKMRSQGCAPNSRTFVAALKICTCLALDQDGSRRAECIKWGKQIHSEIGCHSNAYVQNTLIDMYSKCGCLIEARHVFDCMNLPDVVSWNALILGYTQNGEGVIALDLYAKMRSQGFVPDSVTFVTALKACTSLALGQDASSRRAEGRDLGRQIHSQICNPVISVQNTLIDMYSKCGSMVEARQVFDGIKCPDVVSWNSLISGHAENGEGATALDLFERMKLQGFTPDSITLVAALKACGVLGALESGSNLHANIHAAIGNGTERSATILVNCLLDFYAKCGSMADAKMVFDLHLMTRNLVTWNALLAGYSRLGDKEAVFGLFERMQDAGVQPDGVTFLCILTCCSHSGLIEKANKFFEVMSTNYGIAATIEHYNCMIDILGRLNKLDDSIALLQSMPCRPNAVTWMTILGACVKWKNVQIGRLAFQSVVILDDTNAAAYVLMAHIYGSMGMMEERKAVLGMKEKIKAREKKEP